jgi:subtilisin family serine protease
MPAGLPNHSGENFMLQSIPQGRLTRYVASRATLGVLALTLAACQDSVAPGSSTRAASAAPLRSLQDASSRIPDEYIVVFNDDVGDVSGHAKSLVNAHGGSLHFTYAGALRGFSAHMSAQAAAAIENDPNVAYVEQDQTMTAASLASTGTQSPVYQWGIDRIDQRGSTLDLSYSWLSDASGVTVYILDTGIRITHQDFGGRASYGPDFVSSTSSDDCNGHGTHMAGTVGGSYYGVAKNVSLVAVRVLDCSGVGTASAAIAGLDWVTRNHAPLSVANLSFSGAFSSTVNQAVANAIAAGVTVVAAAGDNGMPPDACQYSPSSAPGAITVGAMRQTDLMAGFSNYGPCVDLFAPGFSITSDWYTGDNIVWVQDGTSSAAAHASGAAAIFMALNPSATPADVSNALTGNATAGALTGLGSGSPNLLLYTGDGSAPPPPPPPAPTTNNPPTASFTASCSRAKCSFNGSGSKDDVGIVSYSWTFGDGASLTSTSATASHTYTAKGSYSETVTLTVTDAGGLTGTAQKTITIKNGGGK